MLNVIPMHNQTLYVEKNQKINFVYILGLL